MKKTYEKTIFLVVILVLFICGCERSEGRITIGSGNGYAAQSVESEEEESELEKDYENAVFKSVDTDNKTAELYIISKKAVEQYTYTGGSDVRNRYGDIISISQIKPGEIVKVYSDEDENKISALYISDDAFENAYVNKFTIDRSSRTITIAGVKYQYLSDIYVTSDGEETVLLNIEEVDQLIVRGIDKVIYSIDVKKGHGFVYLKNYSYFIDGTIEIGKTISTISEDMVLVVPEGNYTAIIKNKSGTGGTKSVIVKRNEDTYIDVASLKDDTTQYISSIVFKISPKDAILYIDGEETDYSEVVTLEFGEYELAVSADGYEIYSQILNVEETYYEVDIELTEEETTVHTTTQAAETSTALQEETTSSSRISVTY